MDLMSLKIISLQGLKLFCRHEVKALQNLWLEVGLRKVPSLGNDIFELRLRGHLQLYANDAILIYSESNNDDPRLVL
jgi:hypothetical protein